MCVCVCVSVCVCVCLEFWQYVLTKKCVHEMRLPIVCCCLLFGFLVHSFSNCLPLRSRSVDERFGFLVHATNWCNVSLAFWPFSPWFTRIVKDSGENTDRPLRSQPFLSLLLTLSACVPSVTVCERCVFVCVLVWGRGWGREEGGIPGSLSTLMDTSKIRDNRSSRYTKTDQIIPAQTDLDTIHFRNVQSCNVY